MACSPDGIYCVVACGEKIYVWQVRITLSHRQHVNSPYLFLYCLYGKSWENLFRYQGNSHSCVLVDTFEATCFIHVNN